MAALEADVVPRVREQIEHDQDKDYDCGNAQQAAGNAYRDNDEDDDDNDEDEGRHS